MSFKRNLVPVLFALGLAACHNETRPVVVAPEPEPLPVSIEVEVFDPVSNFVWQDVGVRILEADQEWSGSTVVSPFPDDWYFTDEFGLVYLDEFSLALAEIGFLEDTAGGAIISPDPLEDEALVVLELDALGFTPVIVEVPVTWDVPDVFTSVPF